MSLNKIIVVGGGTAGCMSAYTLKKLFPKKEVTMIESKNIPTVGVGESTLGHINKWLALVGIKDSDFMKECNASYKLSIRFQDFYKKGDGGFHYPFGQSVFTDTLADYNDWEFKKILYPKTKYTDFANCYFPIMGLVNNNTLTKDSKGLEPYNFKTDTAYHFDATLFANWLKKQFKKIGGKIVIGDVKVIGNSDGINSLNIKNKKLKADLYIDCTGWKSLLLGECLKEPFESFEDILPNNSAWATHLPYTDKEKELKPYTNCTAIENGWVWNIPLWSRMGTGYVYSDKYISDENALKQFKKYLGRDDLNFKKLKMRVGLHKRIYVKNVCAIGLSAGFIEPLESNGLLSVHGFLARLVRLIDRGTISTFKKEQFNYACSQFFKYFAGFVSMHYALSSRTDTKYWRDIQNRDYKIEKHFKTLDNQFQDLAIQKFNTYFYTPDTGTACIAIGMRWPATDEFALKYGECSTDLNERNNEWKASIKNLEKRKTQWDTIGKQCTPFVEFLRKNIYAN